MNYVLLLGAGFSRNWGGWLADEVFEYLLGCPQITPSLRDLLFDYKRRGGFEAALAKLQEDYAVHAGNPQSLLRKFQDAVSQMFSDMDSAFSSIQFELQTEITYTEFMVATFLTKFDAIFTLNQDVLLERHYLNDNVALLSNGKWNGWTIPGMVRQSGASLPPLTNPNLGLWIPDAQSDFSMAQNTQPYFKLHGSSNWFASATDNVMVIGGNKKSTIDQYPILKFNFEQFHEYLIKPNTRMMIIGYGFGDNHINQIIVNAAENSELSIFLIDPMGIDVIDDNRRATVYSPGAMAVALWPRIIGASRRPLSTTFNKDMVEHSKVMRFFAG